MNMQNSQKSQNLKNGIVYWLYLHPLSRPLLNSELSEGQKMDMQSPEKS